MHTADVNRTESILVEDKPRTYEALSYTWQSQKLSKSIICDGKRLPVTQNLYDALQELQRPTTSRLLWIDAICINQTDNEERSNQVAIMRQIYSRASVVTAWIGQENDEMRWAFGLIEKMATRHGSNRTTLDADPGAIWDEEKTKALNLPPFPSFEWKALARLFENSYFRRIWVVQEIVVAKTVIVRCGSLTTKWEYVDFVARSLLGTGWLRALKDLYGQNVIPNFVRIIGGIKANSLRGRTPPLSRVLSATRRFSSTDVRDKIIAVVGIADRRSLGEAATTLLDYSKSVCELYGDVTRNLIKTEGNLSLLSAVEDPVDTDYKELPSWVPDYSVWQKHTVLGLTQSGLTDAGLRKGIFKNCHHGFADDSQALTVHGIECDEISTVSQHSLQHRTRSDARVILEWLNLVHTLIDNGILTMETFWRTLIGDQGKRIHPAPLEYGTHFDNYVHYAKAQEAKAQDSTGEHWTRRLAARSDFASLPYQAALGYIAPHRKLFSTSKGLVGLGSRSILPGDRICVLAGGRVPYILRKEQNHYRLIGESYIHDVANSYSLKERTELKEILIR